MAPAVNIKSFERVIPMIYAYTHPNYPPHQGWTKIGYTDKQSVEERVRQQNHTAGIDYKILWRDNAMYKDGSGEYFMDHDFHRYLTRYRNVERDKGREWFHIDGKTSQSMFLDFANREIPVSDTASDYILRREQMTNLFVLVDSRHKPQKIDLEFMQWLGENGVPFSIVFTKLDKLGLNVGKANIGTYKQVLLEQWEELPPIFVTSSVDGRGREDLLAYIEELNKL